MKRYLLTLAIAVSASFPAGAYAAVLSSDDIRTIIEDGVLWLSNAQEENGHFRYEYVPYEGEYRNDDNIVRQAGAFFELGEIARYDTKDGHDLEAELLRSARYFEGLSIEGSYNGREFRCIKGEGEPTCKLGATALAAIGLIDFVERYPKYEKEYAGLLEDYRDYFLAMKKEGAGFRYYYNPKTKNQREQESSFSNGEALLALVRFDMYRQDDEEGGVIDETFEYLDSQVPFDSALYLWAMAALKELHAYDPDPRYVAYAERYTAWRLADNYRYRNSTQNRCAYIEGLASAHVLLSETTTPKASAVEREVDRMLAKTSWLQVKPVNLYRYVGGKLLRLANPETAVGGFLTGVNADQLTQRIDYTQHCLSAYLQTLADIRNESL